MGIDLAEIVRPEKIELSTMNGIIYFNELLVIAIYVGIAFIIVITALLQRKRIGLKAAVSRGVLLALISSGLLFSLLTDFVWSRWVIADYVLFHGLSSADKPMAIDGEYYELIQRFKTQLGSNDYALYGFSNLDGGTRDYYLKKLEYYLLPNRNRASAKQIISIYDSDVAFDSSQNRLYLKDRVVADATILYAANPHVFLVKTGR